MTNNQKSIFIGKQVLVRTYSAGVHVGELVTKEGQNILLKNARRIWRWEGAFTLNTLSINGMTGGKTSMKIDLIELDQVIEIMETTELAQSSFVKFEHE